MSKHVSCAVKINITLTIVGLAEREMKEGKKDWAPKKEFHLNVDDCC